MCASENKQEVGRKKGFERVIKERAVYGKDKCK